MDIDRWIHEIDQTTDSFKTAFGMFAVEQLNWKVNPSQWSIAQNIEHLIVINQTYYPVINQVRDQKHSLPWIGKLRFMVRLMGNMILKSVHPNRKRKMKTFSLWEPSMSEIGADIVHRFEQHQEDLKQLITDSSDLLDQNVTISSPANINIVYKLETAFDIIVTHEKRHLEQAREVLAQMKAVNNEP